MLLAEKLEVGARCSLTSRMDSALTKKSTIKPHHLSYYMQVYNACTQKPLGHIVNISNQGMMLVSQRRLLTHVIFNLEIRLPEPLLNGKLIQFDALSHWCHPDVTPGCYDTGFSFSDPPGRLLALTDALTHYFSFFPECNISSPKHQDF